MGGRVRVALVRQRYNRYGGAERFIERALPALEAAGAEPTLIARSAEGWGARRALVVNPPYLGSAWRDASFARAARRTWESAGFDLVQSHERIPGCDVYRAGDGVHAEWLDIRRAARGAAEALGIALNPHHRHVCAAERAMFAHPRLSAVICNSAMVRDEIRRRFGVDPSKLHVIHNGVDLSRFHPRERAALRDGARARLGLGANDVAFLFVGSGFWRKGLDAAIAALAAARDARFVLLVAGRDRHAGRFEAAARAAGVAARVRLLGGQDDVRPMYAAADCFILPTRYDPFPSTALEALAMGVPAIVGRRSGAAEVVREGESGAICDPGDPGGIAARMADAAHGRYSGEAARRAAENHGLEDMASQLTALYATLLRGRRP